MFLKVCELEQFLIKFHEVMLQPWIQSVKNTTVSDFIVQRKDMEDNLQSVLSRLSSQWKYSLYCSNLPVGPNESV